MLKSNRKSQIKNQKFLGGLSLWFPIDTPMPSAKVTPMASSKSKNRVCVKDLESGLAVAVVTDEVAGRAVDETRLLAAAETADDRRRLNGVDDRSAADAAVDVRCEGVLGVHSVGSPVMRAMGLAPQG